MDPVVVGAHVAARTAPVLCLCVLASDGDREAAMRGQEVVDVPAAGRTRSATLLMPAPNFWPLPTGNVHEPPTEAVVAYVEAGRAEIGVAVVGVLPVSAVRVHGRRSRSSPGCR